MRPRRRAARAAAFARRWVLRGILAAHVAAIIAVALLWRDSRRQMRTFQLSAPPSQLYVIIDDGRLSAFTDGYQQWCFRTYWSRAPFSYDGLPLMPIETSTLGFDRPRDDGGPLATWNRGARWLPDFGVACPLWILILLLAPGCLLAGIRSAAWGWSLVRRRRAGTCLDCGYDLRATPTRCPECGRAPG